MVELPEFYLVYSRGAGSQSPNTPGAPGAPQVKGPEPPWGFLQLLCPWQQEGEGWSPCVSQGPCPAELRLFSHLLGGKS